MARIAASVSAQVLQQRVGAGLSQRLQLREPRRDCDRTCPRLACREHVERGVADQHGAGRLAVAGGGSLARVSRPGPSAARAGPSRMPPASKSSQRSSPKAPTFTAAFASMLPVSSEFTTPAAPCSAASVSGTPGYTCPSAAIASVRSASLAASWSRRAGRCIGRAVQHRHRDLVVGLSARRTRPTRARPRQRRERRPRTHGDRGPPSPRACRRMSPTGPSSIGIPDWHRVRAVATFALVPRAAPPLVVGARDRGPSASTAMRWWCPTCPRRTRSSAWATTPTPSTGALGDADDVVLVPHSLGGLVGPVPSPRGAR